MPVDSTTTSTPSSFQGRLAGSFSAVTRTSRPLTKMAPALALTSAERLPCTESCLSKWASVLASARSLTPTTSTSLSLRAVRKKTRPIRPMPLTPTRMLMEGLLVETRGVTGRIISKHPRHGEHTNRACAGCPQRAAAFGGGGSGCQNVIDHDDVTPGHPGVRGEGAADVGAARVGAEIALARRGPRTRQPAWLHAAAQTRGQALGNDPRLIEAALELTGAAQGNRHQRVDVGGAQPGATLLEHQLGQRTGQRAAGLELERMDGVAQRAVVTGGRPRVVPHRRLTRTRAAAPGRPVSRRLEGREGPAAGGAVRRDDARNGRPARCAEWIAAARPERCRADGTERGVEEIERGGRPRLHAAARLSATGRGTDGVPAPTAQTTILPRRRRRAA